MFAAAAEREATRRGTDGGCGERGGAVGPVVAGAQLAVSPFLSHSNSLVEFTLHLGILLYQAPSWTWRTRSKRSQRHARNGSDAQKRGAHGRLMARKRPWSKLQCSNTFCGSQEPTARRAAPRPAAASRRGSKPRRDGPIG